MAATYKEIIYICLDQIKASNGDSFITQDHVLVLANHYRPLLIEEKKRKKGESSLTTANEQTVCINLESVESGNGLDYCGHLYLKSSKPMPDVLYDDTIRVNFADKFNIRTAFVSKERFKYVGYNKYLKNILYCAIGEDKHLYIRSQNSQFKYLQGQQAKVSGVFQDAVKAAEMSCNTSENNNCDFLDQPFPIDADLVAQLTEVIVKTLLGVQWRPTDVVNNANDDLADLIAFVRRNMKSPLAKQMTE